MIEIVLILHLTGTGLWVEHKSYDVTSECMKELAAIVEDNPRIEGWCIPREVKGTET